MPTPSCFIWDKHWSRCALAFALPSAGSNIAARIAMIAITTRSSIKVKARSQRRSFGDGYFFGIPNSAQIITSVLGYSSTNSKACRENKGDEKNNTGGPTFKRNDVQALMGANKR